MLKRRRTEQDDLLGARSFPASAQGAAAAPAPAPERPPRPRKRARRAPSRLRLAIAAAILVSPYVLLLILVRGGAIRPLLESRLSQDLGRQVRIGSLRLSPGFGALIASDVSVADDPVFSPAPFLHAQKVVVKVERWPLLTERRFAIVGLDIQEPTVTLIRYRGQWNYDAILAGAPPASAESAGPAVSIRRGILVVRSVNREEPVILRDIAFDAPRLSMANDNAFAFAANLAGGGSLKLNGRAGPVKWAGRASSIPHHVLVNAKGLAVAESNLLSSMAPGLGGLLSFDAAVDSDGARLEAKGTAKLEKGRFSQQGTPAAEALTFGGVSLDYDFATHSGRLLRCDASLPKGDAAISGSFELEGEGANVNLEIVAHGVAVTPMSGLLAAAGVPLPAGTSLQGGIAVVELAMKGRLNAPTTTGKIALHNTKLMSFDLEDRLAGIAGLDLLHLSRDLPIDQWESTVRLSPEGVAIADLRVDLPEVGIFTGSGAIDTNRTLDFKIVAVRNGIAEKRGIPFVVRGAAVSPVFREPGKPD